MERYRPILRASILISFLGYLTVWSGYLYEIGLPWRFWHPIVMWNHDSVLFDVCVCIMTYTTVLTFEFAPAVIEKLPWKGLRETVLHLHHKILIGVVLAGVLLSSMHQSFLGGLYLHRCAARCIPCGTRHTCTRCSTCRRFPPDWRSP